MQPLPPLLGPLITVPVLLTLTPIPPELGARIDPVLVIVQVAPLGAYSAVAPGAEIVPVESTVVGLSVAGLSEIAPLELLIVLDINPPHPRVCYPAPAGARFVPKV